MTEAEWKNALKAHHICPNCKSVDAYTMAGRRLCANCAEKDAAAHRKLRESEDYRNRCTNLTRRWRSAAAADGRCTRCGREKPEGYRFKVCTECRGYCRKSAQERREKAGKIPRVVMQMDGKCSLCGKDVIPGKKVCEKCYAVILPAAMRNLEKARENQVWRGKATFKGARV